MTFSPPRGDAIAVLQRKLAKMRKLAGDPEAVNFFMRPGILPTYGSDHEDDEGASDEPEAGYYAQQNRLADNEMRGLYREEHGMSFEQAERAIKAARVRRAERFAERIKDLETGIAALQAERAGTATTSANGAQ